MRKVVPGVLATLVSLAAAPTSNLPRKAPDQVIHFVDGKTAKVSDYSGKVVLVAFILTGCPHCQHTVTLLNTIQNDLGKRGFQAVALAVNADAPRRLSDFISTWKPAFPVGYCDARDGAEFMKLAKDQRPLAPLLAFIDRKGMIRAQTDGNDAKFFDAKEADHIRAQVLKLLGSGK